MGHIAYQLIHPSTTCHFAITPHCLHQLSITFTPISSVKSSFKVYSILPMALIRWTELINFEIWYDLHSLNAVNLILCQVVPSVVINTSSSNGLLPGGIDTICVTPLSFSSMLLLRDHICISNLQMVQANGSKPLFQPILAYCQLDLKETISIKFYMKF